MKEELISLADRKEFVKMYVKQTRKIEATGGYSWDGSIVLDGKLIKLMPVSKGRLTYWKEYSRRNVRPSDLM